MTLNTIFTLIGMVGGVLGILTFVASWRKEQRKTRDEAAESAFYSESVALLKDRPKKNIYAEPAHPTISSRKD